MSATTPAQSAPPAPSQDLSALQARVDHFIDRLKADPNDTSLVDAYQAILADSGRDLAVQRLLFEWYTLPQLSHDMKGALLLLVINLLRDDAPYADRMTFGLDPKTEAFKSIHRGIKIHLDNAVESLSLISRLQAGLYTRADSPKFIVAVPKSGSSLLGICLGNMIRLANGGQLDQNPFEWRGYPAWWQEGRTHDWDLRPEIGADPLFLRYPGGVYKGHIPPTPKNLHVLNLYPESRYVVTIRDPRDQLAAWYCHRRRSQAGSSHVPEAHEVHECIDALIHDGTLLEFLEFTGKWLALRDPERSMVTTYEELVDRPLDTLRRLRDLYDLKVTEEQVKQIHDYATPVTHRESGIDRSGHDRAVYPLGWTGRIGIHESYFSPANRAAFDEVFQAFGKTCPWGKAICHHYPDLPL